MTKTIGLIFPNQLFKNVEIAKHTNNLFLIEYSLFFGEKKYIQNFHKNKLILHRASMKSYFDSNLRNYNAHYVEFKNSDFTLLFEKFQVFGKIITYEPKDFLLEKRLRIYAKKFQIELEFIPNPNFLTSKEIYNDYFNQHRYFMTPFYIEQRKRLKILVDKNNKPHHEKWTFDTENREKMPKNLKAVPPKFFGKNDYVLEAKKYVEKNYPNNIGETENFIYPTNHKEALLSLHDFLEKRLNEFGPYEDAIS